MAVESPANISIIGLNPLSIEAALYARFLGYQVSVLGRQLIPDWSMSPNPAVVPEHQTTPLGIQAILAQSASDDGASVLSKITNRKTLFEHYVSHLAQSDLLIDSVIENCLSVDAAVAEEPLPEKVDEDVEYDTRVFELRLKLDNGAEPQVQNADVLIDCRSMDELNELEHQVDFELEPLHGPDEPDLANDPNRLLMSEPDYYQLGEGSSTSPARFDFRAGLKQIRDLFRIICDRSELDLYAN